MLVLRELLEQQEAATRARFTFLECDAVIRIAHKHRDIPKQYRRCPYCNGAVAIHFESWTRNDDGTWSAEFAKADCLTEPSERSRKYNDWLDQHTYMPYVYWLPLETVLTEWVNKHYRFNVQDHQ